jgi:O-antigen/teichoic acid export membrane protein
MTPSTLKTLKSQWTTQLLLHLKIPLFRNGYALVSSAALTSGLGMLYWIVAARQYSSETVGVNSALISMMIFIASISQLDLSYALNRFLPQAGQKSVLFIAYTYGLTVSLAFVVSTGFVLGSRIWSPTVHGYFESQPYARVWFIAACMAWCIFALQDSVMTGLRQATWVPLENLIFSIGKLALLFFFASRFASIGVFGSWTIMVFLLLLPVNWFIFTSLVPTHVQSSQHSTKSFSFREVGRFIAGNYFASLFWASTTDLLPLLVVELISSEANAYFYLSWTIAYSLYLISRNMGMSLITEGARDEGQLQAYSYKVLVQNGRLIILALLFILPLAGPLLQLFGQEYANESIWVLRLLCLSALPNIVTALYSSIVRVQKRMKALLILYASICFLVVSLSILLMPRVGILGGGIAWLVGQTVVATVLMATELRPIWLPHLPIQRLQPLLNLIRNGRQFIRDFHNRAAIIQALKELPEPQWQFVKLFKTVGDVAVGLVQSDQTGEEAILKVTTSRIAKSSLKNHVQILAHLKKIAELDKEQTIFPNPIFVQDHRSLLLIEEQKSGIVLSDSLQWENWEPLFLQSIKEISTIHHATHVKQTISEAHIQSWITLPCQNILQLSINHRAVVTQMNIWLADIFSGSFMKTCLIHGDYCPSNIVLSSAQDEVVGILDWERATRTGLPEVDRLHLWLTVQTQLQEIELGQLIIDELIAPSFESEFENSIGKRPLLLLTWLWHINSNLCKANRFGNNPIWIKNNIEDVLVYLEKNLAEAGTLQ